LYQQFGTTGLEDKRSGPNRAWNRVPDDVLTRIIDLALDQPELSQIFGAHFLQNGH